MKASLKFREEKNPLFRAKVPLSILGLPFQSGMVAGESKELTLNLGTFFESGPAIKVAYRPNDTWNPFSVVVKTGSGSFGSPLSSFMIMSAEFNLLGRGNPSFMLHFKPRIGDFSIKKSQSSVFDRKVRSGNGVASDDDSSVEVVESPVLNGGYLPDNGLFHGKRITMLPRELPTASAISGLFSGMEVSATTKVPVRSSIAMNFRWGVRVPDEPKIGAGIHTTGGIALHKIPFLVLNKIGMEHLDSEDSNGETKVCSDVKLAGDVDVAGSYLTIKRQLEVLQFENGLLKNSMEDLQKEICGGNSRYPAAGKRREADRNGVKPLNAKKDWPNDEKKPVS